MPPLPAVAALPPPPAPDEPAVLAPPLLIGMPPLPLLLPPPELLPLVAAPELPPAVELVPAVLSDCASGWVHPLMVSSKPRSEVR
jgi:hypothetical protein